MASRSYKRDSRGRFAGGGSATMTTRGRVGGFAVTGGGRSASASRPSPQRASRTKSLGATVKKAALSSTGQKVIGTGVAFGLSRAAGAGAAAYINRGQKQKSSPGFRPVTKGGRVEVVGAVSGGRSLLSQAAKAATATNARPPSPNYGAAKGKKEYVGRRVTDGNYGFVLRKG